MIRWVLLFIPLLLSALEFKVATYNVENLFDAQNDGNEYEEYKPNTKHGWNEAMLQIKIANIARVITDMDADIIALEEVENKAVLQKLNAALGSKMYPYLFYPNKKERVNIETALLSRFPIEKTSSIFIKDQARGIHRITLKIDNKRLDVYINHWPAQKEKEEERLIYATTLHNLLLKEEGSEYLLLGDFNSPYQVQKDWGMGLVTILNAGDKKSTLYNLWYDLPVEKRYSHSYGKQKATLDHIIIPKTLSDGKGIDYNEASLAVFVRPYMLDENNNPKRWQISDRGRGVHQGEGFSDHFPLTAIFHTSSY
ncbi:exonuclease-endonuclease-phosphatase (EEP) domain-containing protein [Sulfurospirillum diekertiae]|uniref:Exonuclease-endonuclease-phosphatase (EEP) domain-containing protein n=1 Tax=Sulfurospirillum diekertiae TaxID=1854492 RepID=A0A290HEZ5_9BACT|nr:exonuclease-endonuclease-phosphatase (EEP) domain-containing protein [Sulfurospirillum diekertiae]